MVDEPPITLDVPSQFDFSVFLYGFVDILDVEPNQIANRARIVAVQKIVITLGPLNTYMVVGFIPHRRNNVHLNIS